MPIISPTCIADLAALHYRIYGGVIQSVSAIFASGTEGRVWGCRRSEYLFERCKPLSLMRRERLRSELSKWYDHRIESLGGGEGRRNRRTHIIESLASTIAKGDRHCRRRRKGQQCAIHSAQIFDVFAETFSWSSPIEIRPRRSATVVVLCKIRCRRRAPQSALGQCEYHFDSSFQAVGCVTVASRVLTNYTAEWSEQSGQSRVVRSPYLQTVRLVGADPTHVAQSRSQHQSFCSAQTGRRQTWSRSLHPHLLRPTGASRRQLCDSLSHPSVQTKEATQQQLPRLALLLPVLEAQTALRTLAYSLYRPRLNLPPKAGTRVVQH